MDFTTIGNIPNFGTVWYKLATSKYPITKGSLRQMQGYHGYRCQRSTYHTQKERRNNEIHAIQVKVALLQHKTEC